MRKLFFSLTALLLMVCACSEQIDNSSRYVFQYHTVASYLEEHPVYSEYVDLLKKVKINPYKETSTVYQLMTARGNYTVFAITNDAINEYLQDLVEEGLITEPSWESFTDSVKLDSIRAVIVRNSIIDGFDREDQRYSIDQTDKNTELALPTLSDHRLTINDSKNSTDSFFVNKICPIDPVNHDIPVINGFIHQLHKVIAPRDESCARYLQNILDNKTDGYLMMARVIQACELLDMLSMVRDDEYEQKYLRGEIPDMKDYQAKSGGDKSATAGDPDAHAPEHRKYGYTIFAETDDYWRSQGVDPAAPDALQQLINWIQTNKMYFSEDPNLTDDNYASPKHILYRWVTYHILPMRIPANKLVYNCNEIGSPYNRPILSLPIYEWYCTVGEGIRRLLKIYESKESDGVYLNRFPVLDNALSGTGHELSCDPQKLGINIGRESEKAVVNDITNACIYPIDGPLAYTDAVRDELAKERIRFDLFSLFPEAITNNLRRADSAEGKYQHVYVPQDPTYKYFDNCSILNEETHFIHYNGYRTDWPNYCQDEDKVFGKYDIMFTLPPVPKRGTYELRYKVLATGARGITQVYFGSDPGNLPAAGIPVNMAEGIAITYAGEGGSWSDLTDNGRDEDEIIEIDHKLRNHGLMKAGRHEYGENKTARDDDRQKRHILVRQTLDPKETYYIRFKSVLDTDKKELYLDYFEWCPKEIYDNPSKPEDVW